MLPLPQEPPKEEEVERLGAKPCRSTVMHFFNAYFPTDFSGLKQNGTEDAAPEVKPDCTGYYGLMTSIGLTL